MKKIPATSFKQNVYDCCMKQLDDKIEMLKTALHELKEGAENDSKSSAGDKHETARAMMQLEHEKISRQHDETYRQKNELEKIVTQTVSEKIIKGSLIKANDNYFYLSIALGKINVHGVPVIVLSSQSPLGQKMAGLKKGDSVDMNGIHYVIEEVK
ncbi:MAG: hypothetical protein ABI855_06530 [Bacteroidota bacterium]